MKSLYTDEKNIRILISLLKKHNVKNIITSPGATNISFVASLQTDDFFNVYSCVDERAACYMACGIAEETKQPVVLTCTGATASRNYVPGLTEAYYRKLPIIAITATQHLGRIGQNVAQVLDRSVQFKDIVKKSFQLYSVYTEEDEWACNLSVNDAILECMNDGCGPVHINLVTNYSNNLTGDELPDERVIKRITILDNFPKINNNKIAIFIGSHSKINKNLLNNIDEFCEKYNAVVLCDHTSNYHGKYKILANLVTDQMVGSKLRNIDLMIDLGNVSGAYMTISPNSVWRINTDGQIRDTFKKLKYIFKMDEIEFFRYYNSIKDEFSDNSYYKEWKVELDGLSKVLNNMELPFSNLWVTKNIINKFKNNDIIHLGILNTLRSWNFFESKNNLNVYCNTGGFGIDGVLSSAVGHSLVVDNNVYCILGDLAFFYDMNSIGNRDIKNNFRILLINNGCGTEFHNYNHRAVVITKENDLSLKYIAADGHFGNKSKSLVKHYAEDLGFQYISASNKKEFHQNIDLFISNKSEKPILFEIFTNAEDESKALKDIHCIKRNLKSIAYDILGEKGKKTIKKILKK